LEPEVEAARAAERAAAEAAREARTALALWQERQRTREQVLARREQAQARLGAIDRRLSEMKEADRANSRASVEESGEAARLEGAARALDVKSLREELEESLEQRRYLEGEVTRWTQVFSDKREAVETARVARARREASLEALLAEHPESADTGEEDPEGTPRSWAQRAGQINGRLAEIGPVNPLAASELATEGERLSLLEQGAADARESAEELEAALDELEREVTARLHQAIARVSHAFREYSHDLLGGDGELEVVRDENGLLEGLALRVQPKGKRTRSLHLLSAGERTMAALAFLFALSAAAEDAGGLPLAILDEVDAPLDEANIRRFTHFLRLLSGRGTQFVLVTHQKATMEIADALWGVTTDTGGLSRTFSIRHDPMAAD
ncbi:MAG TPA: AAA family ATPase, partial [Deinococcales bacterium]|nr:AAA family ATPase [Deinococcales bacterium]